MNKENWKIIMNLENIYDHSPSYFINMLATANINGLINDIDLEKELYNFYQGHIDYPEYIYDLILIRMKKLLSSNYFELTEEYLFFIHQYLYKDIYPFAGKQRTQNIIKKEKCINLNSVYYSSKDLIMNNLHTCFNKEQLQVYGKMDKISICKYVISFISNIWQIHPFIDGNTRCIIIFSIQYLRYLGINVNLDFFLNNFKYFRNALVRSNLSNGININPSKEYLYNFLECLINNDNIILNEKETYISNNLF